MRQNAELQQRQSSLERRAAYQKSLLAANRDQMQARLQPSSPHLPPLYMLPRQTEPGFEFAMRQVGLWHRSAMCLLHYLLH